MFEFELYRLNIIDSEDALLEHHLPGLFGNDEAVVEVLRHATSPQFTYTARTEMSVYSWVLREFVDYQGPASDQGWLVGVTMARSIEAQTGEIVTDTGIVEGVSQADPPQAKTMELIFRMQRHVVMAERYATLTATMGWKVALENILRQATQELGLRGRIELEPIPRTEEIMTAFRSFEILTRMRLILRLPNPELSRYAEHLCTDMLEGGIREYMQDMSNPNGLSRDEGKLPHASAEIAEKGYKKGTVRLTGIRNGRRESVDTGGKAARGTVDRLRDFVHGMKVNARAQETQRTLQALCEEMDRLAPPPEQQSNASPES
jgi:hypothetical protein